MSGGPVAAAAARIAGAVVLDVVDSGARSVPAERNASALDAIQDFGDEFAQPRSLSCCGRCFKDFWELCVGVAAVGYVIVFGYALYLGSIFMVVVSALGFGAALLLEKPARDQAKLKDLERMQQRTHEMIEHVRRAVEVFQQQEEGLVASAQEIGAAAHGLAEQETIIHDDAQRMGIAAQRLVEQMKAFQVAQQSVSNHLVTLQRMHAEEQAGLAKVEHLATGLQSVLHDLAPQDSGAGASTLASIEGDAAEAIARSPSHETDDVIGAAEAARQQAAEAIARLNARVVHGGPSGGPV